MAEKASSTYKYNAIQGIAFCLLWRTKFTKEIDNMDKGIKAQNIFVTSAACPLSAFFFPVTGCFCFILEKKATILW